MLEKQTPQKAPSNLAIVGRYAILFRANENLEHTASSLNGDIRLTDALDDLLGRQGLNEGETDSQIFDCSNKQDFLSPNLETVMPDPETKNAIKVLHDVSDSWVSKDALVAF